MTAQWKEVVDSLAELKTEEGGLAYAFVVRSEERRVGKVS